ncbi:MAG TPA: hypothetical protein PKH24_19045 [Sedimentisphaerales bacterium]|nr:hypothetical protein [Sedimentisphaerales bacterium]HNU31105.1 hypothetical protein [Sedimentisphaerales bacterium]
MLYYDWQFAERIQCSVEEKRECFDLILQLRKYASIIRKEGFLALEEELKHVNDEFLAISIQMGIDGVNPELFREIQERRILVDNCKGKELLRRVIITEAMASILSQDAFMTFQYKLLSYLGQQGYRWAKEQKLDLIGKGP